MASAVSRIEGLWTSAEPLQKKAVVYGAILAAGAATNSRIALGIGLGGLLGALIEMSVEGSLLKNPEQMNAYFQTQGKLSAVRGPAEARALKRRQLAARRGQEPPEDEG